MRPLIVIFILIFLSGCGSLQTEPNNNKLSVKVLRSGVYTGAHDCQTIEEKQLAAGYQTSCGFSGFMARDTVEKNSDVAFGFEYLIVGFKKDRCYTLTHKVIHPPFSPFGKKLISSQQRSFRLCWSDTDQGIYNNDYLWAFDEEWEKAPGEWSLMLQQDNQTLVQQNYVVY
ncbi:MAG: DUF3859 domain-containing protein [Candidatus Thiodiazotropha sp.]